MLKPKEKDVCAEASKSTSKFKAQPIVANASPSQPRSEPSTKAPAAAAPAAADDDSTANLSWRRRCSSSMEGEASVTQFAQPDSPLVSPRFMKEHIAHSHFRKLSVVGDGSVPTAGDDPKEAPAHDPDDPAGVTATVHIKRTDMPDYFLQGAVQIAYEVRDQLPGSSVPLTPDPPLLAGRAEARLGQRDRRAHQEETRPHPARRRLSVRLASSARSLPICYPLS